MPGVAGFDAPFSGVACQVLGGLFVVVLLLLLGHLLGHFVEKLVWDWLLDNFAN